MLTQAGGGTWDRSRSPGAGTSDPDGAVDAVGEAIDELDERGRESVVLTAVGGERQLTDTTSAIHRSDLDQPSFPFDHVATSSLHE